MDSCRCGYSGEGPHPCHSDAYQCRKPATQRFYNPQLVALAGMQMKVGISETWACDDCWEDFLKQVREAQAKAERPRST